MGAQLEKAICQIAVTEMLVHKNVCLLSKGSIAWKAYQGQLYYETSLVM